MKRFRALAGRMAELGIDRPYLAKKLNISLPSVDRRFAGKQPWKLDEMYRTLDIIQKPEKALHYFFPRNGGIAS